MKTSTYSTRLFTYDTSRGWFIAEASTLAANTNDQPLFGQVYSDACDEGIQLVSHATGHETLWHVHETKRQDGEIQAWILKPTPETLRKTPSLRNIEVHILND